MPIMIDGWNFIRCPRSPIDDDEGDSSDSAAILMDRLRSFQIAHNDPITVVFDSTHGFIDAGHQNSPKLKMVAARDADEYIKRHIAKVPERQRRNLKVVSSDGDVYHFAKTYGATPVRSEEFWPKVSR
jgi:predicted RNA-binding protein with PIN domain